MNTKKGEVIEVESQVDFVDLGEVGCGTVSVSSWRKTRFLHPHRKLDGGFENVETIALMFAREMSRTWRVGGFVVWEMWVRLKIRVDLRKMPRDNETE